MTKRQERSWRDENKEAHGGGNEKIGEVASEKESAIYTAYCTRWPARRNGKIHTTKHTTAQMEKGRVNRVESLERGCLCLFSHKVTKAQFSFFHTVEKLIKNLLTPSFQQLTAELFSRR